MCETERQSACVSVRERERQPECVYVHTHVCVRQCLARRSWWYQTECLLVAVGVVFLSDQISFEECWLCVAL